MERYIKVIEHFGGRSHYTVALVDDEETIRSNRQDFRDTQEAKCCVDFLLGMGYKLTETSNAAYMHIRGH